MKDSHRDCIEEIQELMLQILEVVKKYELEDEVLVAMAVGFLNMDTAEFAADPRPWQRMFRDRAKQTMS